MTPPVLTLDDGDVRLLLGDALDALRALPSGIAQTCITSPPFWGLRDYGTGRWDGGDDACDHLERTGGTDASTLGSASGGHAISPEARERSTTRSYVPFRDVCGKCGARRVDDQIGLEETPSRWAARLMVVFREVRRVLRDDGTLWVEVGDSYATNPGNGRGGEALLSDPHRSGRDKTGVPGLKTKDLAGTPWLLAFALRADGWFLRSDVIWSRPNPIPESVTDRPTKAHSYLFLLSKSGDATYWTHRDGPGSRTRPAPDYRWVHRATGAERADPPPEDDAGAWRRFNLWRGRDYFYDPEPIREAMAPASAARYEYAFGGAKAIALREADKTGPGVRTRPVGMQEPNPAGANARSVWTIATESVPYAHFATFPRALVRRCIAAGTSERGACPACGAPWTRRVERTRYEPETVEPGVRLVDPSRGDQVRRLSGAEYNAQVRVLGETWAPSCRCDAGPPVAQLVLDPFVGSGTTALVARRLGRRALGIDLNPEYLALASERLAQRTLLDPADEDDAIEDVLDDALDRLDRDDALDQTRLALEDAP